MPAIFDNVRDGLILLRFPEEVVVLFNRAASETCGLEVAEVLGRTLQFIIPDPKVAETARYCAEQPVGEWPGHNQDVLPTTIDGPGQATRDVELHFCRVDDPESGKPLVLLVMRPDDEAELENLAHIAKQARQQVSKLEARLHKRRMEAASRSPRGTPHPRSKHGRAGTVRSLAKTNRPRRRATPRAVSREAER